MKNKEKSGLITGTCETCIHATEPNRIKPLLYSFAEYLYIMTFIVPTGKG
jgi:hypothetical protein